MEYACYCNRLVTGGGAVPGKEDPNDALCLDLYKCYKCINIDYDIAGKYNTISYDAKYDESENSIKCKDDKNDPSTDLGNLPFNICDCDRKFANNLLENYKQCLNVSFFLYKILLKASESRGNPLNHIESV